MDKSLRCFLYLVSIFFLLLFLSLFMLGYYYFFSPVGHNSYVILFLMITSLGAIVLFISSTMAIFHTYRHSSVRIKDIWLVRIGLDFLLPSLILLSGVLGVDRDQLWGIYVRINNAMVKAAEVTYSPHDILLLLPHCLQNRDCTEKVVQDIRNCRSCGRCYISELRNITMRYKVPAVVVSGGTSARSIVKERKPGLVLAVACERELASGVTDISQFPVICIINQRPSGACCNTKVDVREVEEHIMTMTGLTRDVLAHPAFLSGRKM